MQSNSLAKERSTAASSSKPASLVVGVGQVHRKINSCMLPGMISFIQCMLFARHYAKLFTQYTCIILTTLHEVDIVINFTDEETEN